jgi:6-phosphogluconate dehydrogenase
VDHLGEVAGARLLAGVHEAVFTLGTERVEGGLRGYAADSGEGRWTVEAAIDNAVPLPAITASLFARFGSRQDDSPQMKMIAALRNQFGGHAVESAKKK